MKIFIKRTIVCILSAICCFAFSACEIVFKLSNWDNSSDNTQSSSSNACNGNSSPQDSGSSPSSSSPQDSESSPNNSSPQDGSDLTSSPVDDTPMSSSGSHMSAPTMYLKFPVSDKSSMVLAEFVQVYEGYYWNGGVSCVIAEYKVITDYYRKLDQNTIILVPFVLSDIDGAEKVDLDIVYGESSDSISAPDISEIETVLPETVSGFLQQYQQSIIYIRRFNEEIWYKNGNYKDQVSLNIAEYRTLSFHEFIPLRNNVVCTDDLYRFYEENNCLDSYMYPFVDRLSEFVCDGMSLQQLEINIEKLYTNTW